jgi:cytochrome c553/cytochrome c5
MRLLRLAILLIAFAGGMVMVVRDALSPRRAPPATPSPETRGGQDRKSSLKRWALRVAVFLPVLAVAGFLVVASGIVPIKASSGHWAITAWFLHFAMRRSVATHTLGLEAPALDEPGLILKGAGHYETGCRPCHGSPELAPPKIVRRMTPHPPHLPPRLSQWDPEGLFYIVKHGVKFTGMPAWPALQRDDEVWAVVAFLRTLPDLDAEAYRRLVHGESAPNPGVEPLSPLLGPKQVPRAVTASCGRCHGVDGRGRGMGAFPKLAGQRPVYLFATMQAYARGARASGIMEPLAAALSQEEIHQLAQYYAGLREPVPSPSNQHTSPEIERGRAIAHQGVPTQRVPSCVDCHGPHASRRNPVYPELAGQYADYLLLQLQLFKRGQRGGTAYAHLMRQVVARLTPEQMRDVALYYASLPAAREASAP